MHYLGLNLRWYAMAKRRINGFYADLIQDKRIWWLINREWTTMKPETIYCNHLQDTETIPIDYLQPFLATIICNYPYLLFTTPIYYLLQPPLSTIYCDHHYLLSTATIPIYWHLQLSVSTIYCDPSYLLQPFLCTIYLLQPFLCTIYLLQPSLFTI